MRFLKESRDVETTRVAGAELKLWKSEGRWFASVDGAQVGQGEKSREHAAGAGLLQVMFQRLPKQAPRTRRAR